MAVQPCMEWIPISKNGFRSSCSTAGFLTVASVRIAIARAFSVFGATWVPGLYIAHAFGRVKHAVLLHKLKSYRISDKVFGRILSFLSNRWKRSEWMTSLQEYQINAGFPQGTIWVQHFPTTVSTSCCCYL